MSKRIVALLAWLIAASNPDPCYALHSDDNESLKPPEAPRVHAPAAVSTTGEYTVSWDAVREADAYEVFEYNRSPAEESRASAKLRLEGNNVTSCRVRKETSGARHYRVRAWKHGAGTWIGGPLSDPSPPYQVQMVLTDAQRQTLMRYAKASLRYFTSPNSNNLLAGLPHSFYGTGKRREPATLQEADTTRERGSHVNLEEVTVRFLALAVGYKEGWLDYLPEVQRYASSWGQINTGLATLRLIQTSAEPFHVTDGTFHRWYWTAYDGDKDIPPRDIRADTEMNQASDDNALAFMNLLLLEGLAADASVSIPDRGSIITLSRAVRSAINLRRFFFPGAWIEQDGSTVPRQADVIIHQFINGQPSLKYKTPEETTGADQGIWDRAGAEGPVIAAAALLSKAISLDEFYSVARGSLAKKTVAWDSFGTTIPIEQTTYDAAIFMTGVRALHGIPVTAEEEASASFFVRSALPVFQSHLAFAQKHGLSALGTHAMSQTIAGLRPYYYWPFAGAPKHGLCQFPGNEENRMPDPRAEYGANTMARSTSPHAFFVPLGRGRYLSEAEKSWIFDAMARYEPEFFHQGSEERLGWEAVIPWAPNDDVRSASWRDSTRRRNYSDEGRPYEALNSAYIVLHVFDALHPERPLAGYSVERERLGQIAAYFDSGKPLPQ